MHSYLSVEELSSDSTIALQRLDHLDSLTICSRGRRPRRRRSSLFTRPRRVPHRHRGPVSSTPRPAPSESPAPRAALSTSTLRPASTPVHYSLPLPAPSPARLFTPRPASPPAHFSSSGRRLHRSPGPHVPSGTITFTPPPFPLHFIQTVVKLRADAKQLDQTDLVCCTSSEFFLSSAAT